MTGKIYSPNDIPARFSTFKFRGSKYKTLNLVCGKTTAELKIKTFAKRAGHSGVRIHIRSGHNGCDFFTPAEIIYPTPNGLVRIVTMEAENLILLDPICSELAGGHMPTNIKTTIGLLQSRGYPLEFPRRFDFRDKRISTCFLVNIEQTSSIDYLALFIGIRENPQIEPQYAAQMYFSTLEEWECFAKELH
jgi:hypothetical protein